MSPDVGIGSDRQGSEGSDIGSRYYRELEIRKFLTVGARGRLPGETDCESVKFTRQTRLFVIAEPGILAP